jgi:hypothetical protein
VPRDPLDFAPMLFGLRRARLTVAACAAMLVAFAALAGSAASTKSPTMDEPGHALSGWVALRQADYRLDVTNPAAWKMFAALGDLAASPQLAGGGPLWQPVAWQPSAELPWARTTLFDTPGNDGGRFVGRARAMMLVVAVALGVAIAAWSSRLGGPVAAVVALGLFAFDPNFLAHASLVKSDVAEGLALLGLSWATWRFGQRATVARAVGLGLLCAAAVNVKFSGLLAGPVLVALLAARAAGPTPWPAFGRVAGTRGRRMGVAAMSVVVAGASAHAFTWAVYRFRYRPAPDPAVAIDLPAVLRYVTPPAGPGPLVQLCAFADHHHLLPQAFVAGLLNQVGNVHQWPAYLDGAVYTTGKWQYYPLAAAYKTPLAELGAWAGAAAVAIAVGLTRGWRRPGAAWAVACVGGPAVAFGAAAVTAGLNVGLRNVLPVYALADVAVGCAAAWAWRRWRRTTSIVLLLLATGQVAAAITAWPDYIPFFNAAVGGPVAGRAHLGDGNLDWGQDVPALVDWQRAHPDVPLYADLFTPVDPAFYGLRYHKLWERTPAGRPELHLPPGPAVLAVSATHLQGLYVDGDQVPLLDRLAVERPREVLHGTIYLFDYRP